jgi:outer membrane receptor protein involved in Fe transport
MPPKNKFNVISDFSFNNGMSFNLLGRYVDETKWDIDTDNNSIPEEHNIKSYFTFDIRLAYKLPNTQANIILILNNLFNSVHKEYPIGEGIGRRVGIRINVKF